MRVHCPDVPINVIGTWPVVWPLLELIEASEITWRIERLDNGQWKYSSKRKKERLWAALRKRLRVS